MASYGSCKLLKISARQVNESVECLFVIFGNDFLETQTLIVGQGPKAYELHNHQKESGWQIVVVTRHPFTQDVYEV